MDVERFLAERGRAWRRLQQSVETAERDGLRALPTPALCELGWLYREASSDLITARTILENAVLSEMLNDLVARAYAVIYQRPRVTRTEVRRFFARDLPRRVHASRGPIALSLAVLLSGMLVGAVSVVIEPDAFAAFVPPEYAELYGRPGQDLRARRFGDLAADESAAFSAQLTTNNTRVAFLAFAGGVTYGSLTVIVLFFNGALLGAIAGNFWSWDQSLELWALILPHGGVELTCVIVTGGAGLALGRALLLPGPLTRGASLAAAAREALPLALGMVPFILMAGLIEAFVTPLAVIGPWAKIAIGAVSAALFWVYLFVPRSER